MRLLRALTADSSNQYWFLSVEDTQAKIKIGGKITIPFHCRGFLSHLFHGKLLLPHAAL
jgi:hypothetical protein